MEVIFIFDRDKDQEKLKMFQQAEQMWQVIWMFSHNIKNRMEMLPEEQYIGYEKAMTDFFQLVECFKVDCE